MSADSRSILCLPLINQTKLAGVLYLENNLARSVFAPARIAVLKLLASQAAISLENAHLYRDLAEREARIQRLVNADIIGIVIWNIEGQILEANDAFLRMVGYDREDLVSGRLSWTDLTPPEWDFRNAETVREVRMTGTAQPFEKEYFRKDGSRVPVLIGSASFEKGGNQGVAFVLDLTERKVAEAALRESEEQWKAVFENNPTMYFMLDPTGTILSVNPFGAEQLGYATDELIGRPVEILFHEDDRDDALRSASKCLEHPGLTASWELRKIRKNGDMLWVRETARAMSIKNPACRLGRMRGYHRGQARGGSFARDADAAHAREPRRDDGAAHCVDRSRGEPADCRDGRQRAGGVALARRRAAEYGRGPASARPHFEGRRPRGRRGRPGPRSDQRGASARRSRGDQWSDPRGDRHHPRRSDEERRRGANGTRRGSAPDSRQIGSSCSK